jgi:hypothetical protein
MAEVMAGAIAADAGIITGGAEVVAIIVTDDLTSRSLAQAATVKACSGPRAGINLRQPCALVISCSNDVSR